MNTEKKIVAKDEDEAKRCKFRELERFVYEHKRREATGIETVTALVGVMAGVKPAGLIDFADNEVTAGDLATFRAILRGLEIKMVCYECVVNEMEEIKYYGMYFVSKDRSKAAKSKKAFLGVHKSLDDEGQILEPEEWTRWTRQIGELLGYPKTAVDAFVAERMKADGDTTKLTRVGDANRYYAHSIEHEREEFEAYDKPLNLAISEWAPFTAKKMQANKKKRWLEF